MEDKELLLQTALWYARHGLPVFPVVCDGKRKAPACPHGCKDATTNEEQVKALWGDKPFNIGLATGTGLICLDVDVHEGGANGLETLRNLEARYGKLPETWAVQTGTGGKHLYFKCDDERLTTAAGFQPGLDYRGRGGYVVAPPSVHENGKRYRWFMGKAPYEIKEPASLPDWLHNLMLEGRAKGRKNPEQLTVPERREVPDLIPEGERNDELFRLACSLRAKGLTETAIFAAVREENLNRCRPPLPEREVQRLCQQAAGYPAGTGKGVVATEENGVAPLEPFDAPIKRPDFPLEALPEGVIPFVREVSEFLQVTPGMVASPVLGIFAAAAQRKYRVSPGPKWEEPLSLWTLTTADPSERKSAALEWAKKPLLQWEAEQNQALVREVDDWNIRAEALKERISAAKKAAAKDDAALEEAQELQAQLRDMEAEEPKFSKLTCGDATPEKLLDVLAENGGRICVLADEGGALETLTGTRYQKVKNLDPLLQAYSGQTIDVARKTSGSVYIEKPALSMCLMTQPEYLMKIMSDGENAGRGFCARFLIALPESLIGTRKLYNKPPSDEAERLYNLVIEALLELGDVKNPQVICFSDKARNALEAAFNEMETELPDMNSDMKSWGGKFIGTAARIAAIFHLCHWGNAAAELPVEEWTVRNAVSVMKYFRGCAEIVFGGGTEEPKTEADARYILERLQGEESISKGKLFDACKRFRRASEMEPGLKELERRGYIRLETQKGKGRPSITIHRNPDAG